MPGEQSRNAADSDLKNKLDLEARARGVKDIPPDLVELVRQRCNLTAEQVEDVMDAVKSGITTPAEYFGVTPDIANTVESMALEFYRQKHFTHAHCLYAFLVEVQRDRATAWRGMGACNQAVRGYPVAVLCYQQAVALNPTDVVSMVYLGECLFIDGWREEGIRTLELAVDVGSKFPAQAPYVKRARAILNAQDPNPGKSGGAKGGGGNSPELDATPEVPTQKSPGQLRASSSDAVDVEALLAMDQVSFSQHPKIYELAKRLQARVDRREITYKDVAGFTDEQMYGGYAAACRLIDAGRPLTALEVIGWMLFYDSRNGLYYQVAGLAAQHAKLFCFSDYLYAMSLVYDRDNPVTMLYQGEVKIYSFERHKGVELLRRAVEMLQKDASQGLLVKRGKALIKQFEKKPSSQQNADGVGSK